MLTTTIQLIGGIGMFLLGMSLMTDSLKAMAGESLRQWLGRFTGSPFKAMMSGIGFTLVVQSSTATTLATIGFVSAGVLSFVQAIGVIVGANIGTTSTGWMVALLGLKFSVTMAALPMLGVGAMMKLLGKDKVALFGLALAGFGLLFVGIDVLQEAMAAFASEVNLSKWSDNRLSTQLLLVLIGIVMTVLLQSSSAAITATLAALAGGAIDLSQALALVIGQNIGTVATAVLAAIGATVSARRTAAVHVVFNVVSAVLAFVILMPLTLWLTAPNRVLADWDNTLIIAFFHTAFSVLGAMIFMPFANFFQHLIENLIKDKPNQKTSETRYLDESLFSVPALAIDTAKKALCTSLADAYKTLVALGNGQSVEKIAVAHLDETFSVLDDYLKKMPVPQSQADQQKLVKLLQLIVYARVVREDFVNTEYLQTLRKNGSQALELVMVQMQRLAKDLANLPDTGLDGLFVQEFIALGDSMKAQKADVRASIVERSAHIQHHAADALELIVAQRWLDKLTKHTAKMALLLANKAPQTHMLDVPLVD